MGDPGELQTVEDVQAFIRKAIVYVATAERLQPKRAAAARSLAESLIRTMNVEGQLKAMRAEKQEVAEALEQAQRAQSDLQYRLTRARDDLRYRDEEIRKANREIARLERRCEKLQTEVEAGKVIDVRSRTKRRTG
jgi:chromosome segregation ATPase